MKKKTKKSAKKEMVGESCSTPKCGGCTGCGYCLGAIGAAVYYISAATGFWNGVLGVLKALVWPAFLVFEALKFLAA